MLNVEALLAPENYSHPVPQLEILETHISWVILTGPYAYKIKKPVNFGFLDFSTLDKRKHFCEEELRLNQRLAADLYLEVIPIYGTPKAPHLHGNGKIIDYALRMRQFPQSAQLDRLLHTGLLRSEYLDAIAEDVARFHLNIEKAAAESVYGQPDQVWQPMAENFTQIREREFRAEPLAQLDALQHWSEASFARLKPVLVQRRRDGFVRECHGDLHLRNIAWFDGKPIIFDCIEFNPSLRWIDVMSDFAFLFMDLIDRDQSTLAYRVLDRYLTRTGDYAGLSVLPFYFVYRALVRAKVDRIRLSQTDVSGAERVAEETEFAGYLQLAQRFTTRAKPRLLITWGLSASGKSWVSDRLLQELGAIRLRSDVERKRLAGLDVTARAPAGIAGGIYTSKMSDRTYAYLLQQARAILEAGFTVIVDAAFLEAQRRTPFAQLARELQAPFIILQCVATASALRTRILQRQNDVSDADLTVLEHQLANLKLLSAEEVPDTIIIDTEQPFDSAKLVERIEQHARQSG